MIKWCFAYGVLVLMLAIVKEAIEDGCRDRSLALAFCLLLLLLFVLGT